MRDVCVVTTTRADYGILSPLIRRIAAADTLRLRLAVSGTHLCEAFGNTVEEIQADGFPIDARIPILAPGDSPEAVSQTMARALEGFAAYFAARAPDMVVLMGDRHELCAVALACVNARIPIAHISGGEVTQGALDDCYRHSITKMSYLHFAACETYRKRIIQLGEDPARVFNTGDLGVENARNTECLSREALARAVDFAPLAARPYVLTTFHPATQEAGTEAAQCEALLRAMEKCPEEIFLCTRANADAGGGRINQMLEAYAASHENMCLRASLGMRRYMSALRHAEMVLGNSSSGILEAPCFGVPTVNIGDRQKGRLMAQSVLCCPPETGAILAAMEKARTPAFRRLAAKAENPYGAGDTSRRILEILEAFLHEGRIDLKKAFYDVNFEVNS